MGGPSRSFDALDHQRRPAHVDPKAAALDLAGDLECWGFQVDQPVESLEQCALTRTRWSNDAENPLSRDLELHSTLLIDARGRLRRQVFGVHDDLLLGAGIQTLLLEARQDE